MVNDVMFSIVMNYKVIIKNINEIIKRFPLLCDYGKGDETNHKQQITCATIPFLGDKL